MTRLNHVTGNISIFDRLPEILDGNKLMSNGITTSSRYNNFGKAFLKASGKLDVSNAVFEIIEIPEWMIMKMFLLFIRTSSQT